MDKAVNFHNIFYDIAPKKNGFYLFHIQFLRGEMAEIPKINECPRERYPYGLSVGRFLEIILLLLPCDKIQLIIAGI